MRKEGSFLWLKYFMNIFGMAIVVRYSQNDK